MNALPNSELQQTRPSLRSAHAAELCYVGQTWRCMSETLILPDELRVATEQWFEAGLVRLENVYGGLSGARFIAPHRDS